MSLEYLCNPLHYVDAMRHKYPAVLNDWCCTELSHVLDFSGSDGLGQILAGLVDVKQGKTFVKRFTRARPRANSHNGVFGAPLTEEGYSQARQLVDYLKYYITKEDIFRRPGNSERQRRLKDKINGGLVVNLNSEEFTPYDVACVLKSFLGDLPEPLLTDRHFAAHVQAAGLTYAMDQVTCATEDLRRKYRSRKIFDHINALRYLFLMLPPINLKILKEILDLLFCISEQHRLNKMTAYNLGVMFAPHILWPRYLTVVDLGDKTLINKLNCGVEFMIIHFHKIFQMPTKMLNRCEQFIKHGKLLDDEKVKSNDAKSSGQDAHVTSKGVVIGAPQKCTIDMKKEQTKTEGALNQLYDSVQEMPSSSKKRKLMKQFAKNCNMPGTPTRVKEDLLIRSQLRHSKRPKHVRSKSAGDAVVKHLHAASSVHRKRPAPNPPAERKAFNGSIIQGSVSCDSDMSPERRRPKRPPPLTPQQRQQQQQGLNTGPVGHASLQARYPLSDGQHARNTTVSVLEKPVPKPRKLKENCDIVPKPFEKRVQTKTAQMHELSSLV